MSGSSGIISPVFGNATSKHTEEARQTSSDIGSLPAPHKTSSDKIGFVTAIHEEYAGFVTANDINHPTIPLAGGAWIELNHTADEIVDRWGTIQNGFKIHVTYGGVGGKKASGTIISGANQKKLEPHIPNSAARGIFAIFPPGIGVG